MKSGKSIFEKLTEKDYGFLDPGAVQGRVIAKKLLCSPDEVWSVTGDFMSEARNHCAATAVTNFVRLKSRALPLRSSGRLNNTRHIFTSAHEIIGNGPVFRLGTRADRYFRENGIPFYCDVVPKKLVRSGDWFSIIQKETDRGNCCGLLVCAGLFAWHWVLCMGYEQLSDGTNVLLIADNWNRRGVRAYIPGPVCRLKGITVFRPAVSA